MLHELWVSLLKTSELLHFQEFVQKSRVKEEILIGKFGSGVVWLLVPFREYVLLYDPREIRSALGFCSCV